MDHPKQPTVFISYSHQDDKWLQELLQQLKPLKDRDLLDCWSDTAIAPGSRWQHEIEQALASAKIAVLLVSPSFLASDFIAKRELPPLLEAASNRELTIVWIPISHSLYKHTEIANYQAAHNPKQPLDTLRKAKRNEILVKICARIFELASLNNLSTDNNSRALRSEPLRVRPHLAPEREVPRVINIKVHFELNTPNGLRRVIFGLEKYTIGNIVTWKIAFQLFERAKKTDPFGDAIVTLNVEVAKALNAQAERAARIGLTPGQSAHALGPAADDARAARDGEIDQDQASQTIQNTLKKN